MGLPCWLSGKDITCQCRRLEFNPWVGKIPWRRKWQPIPIFLPGKSHAQRSLAGDSLWGHKESDRTKRLAFTFQCFFMNSYHRRGLITPLFKVCWDTETRTSESQAVWAKGSPVGVSEPTRGHGASSPRAATGSVHRAESATGRGPLWAAPGRQSCTAWIRGHLSRQRQVWGKSTTSQIKNNKENSSQTRLKKLQLFCS